jgi:hypothetical protein
MDCVFTKKFLDIAVVLLCCIAIVLCGLRLVGDQQTEQLGRRPNRARGVFLWLFGKKGLGKTWRERADDGY